MPARICLSPGNPTEMMITWVTFKPRVNHTVQYNVHGKPLSLNATGTMTKFTDGGREHRVLFIHKTKLTGLTPDQAYGRSIGPLQDPVTSYGINYAGTQIMQWDFQNKGTLTSPARLSFVLKVQLRYLRPSVIYSVPCDLILQRAYYFYVRQESSTLVFVLYSAGKTILL